MARPDRSSVLSRCATLPDDLRDELARTQNRIKDLPKLARFVVVNADPQTPRRGQEIDEQLQPWPHHAEPLIMALQIVLTDDLPEPRFHQRGVHAVVVNPALLASVVRRVNVDDI